MGRHSILVDVRLIWQHRHCHEVHFSKIEGRLNSSGTTLAERYNHFDFAARKPVG